MNELTVQVQGVTLRDMASNPTQYNDETLAAGIEVIKRIEAQTREMKAAISAVLIGKMQEDNATKLLFLDVDGAERTATLKTPPKEINKKIGDVSLFVEQNGFKPEMFGNYEYVPHKWSVIKELRKQGGNVQLVCDELYVDGKPSIDIK